MDLGLRGKKAIVTGGKRGLGFAIATLLAKEGADIAICARGDVSESVAALSAHGTKVVGAGIDAANAKSTKHGSKLLASNLAVATFSFTTCRVLLVAVKNNGPRTSTSTF